MNEVIKKKEVSKKITLVIPMDYYFAIPTVSRFFKKKKNNIKSIIVVENFFSIKKIFYIGLMFNPLFIIKKILGSFKYKDCLKNIARQNEVNIFYTNNINSIKTENFLKKQKTQILVIMSCSQILKKNILKIKNININFHCSDLPKNRGLFPLFYTYIQHGGKKMFLNLHIINEKIDDGKILINKVVRIKKMTLDQMYTRAFMQFEIILKNFINNRYNFKKNDKKLKTYNSNPKFKDYIKYYKICFFS